MLPILAIQTDRMKYSKLKYFVSPVCVLVVWSLIALLSKGNELFFASPRETIVALFSLFKTPDILFDTGYTLWRSLVAVILSIALAIPIALIISLRRSFFDISEFSIDFFRSIPSTALFPLFLVSFGLNDVARIGTAVFICFWIILLSLIHGIFHTSRVRIDAFTLMGASKLQVFKHVLIWEASTFLFSGIKLAVSTSLVIIIITEMLVSPQFGLGTRILLMQQTYKIPQLFALIIIAGILGYFMSKSVVLLERRIIHWTRE